MYAQLLDCETGNVKHCFQEMCNYMHFGKWQVLLIMFNVCSSLESPDAHLPGVI